GLQPVEDHRGIQPARVGENDLVDLLGVLLCHACASPWSAEFYALGLDKNTSLTPRRWTLQDIWLGLLAASGRASRRRQGRRHEHQRAAQYPGGTQPLTE